MFAYFSKLSWFT